MTPVLPPPAQIAAIIPCYTDNGDSTTLFTFDGRAACFSCRSRAVLQRLLKSLAIDLTALRRRVRGLTERTNLEPLPLSAGLVLVPLKVRRPRISGDATIGYINLYAVDKVCASAAKPYQATVTLSGRHELPLLWTAATINRQLALARLAAHSLSTSQPLTTSSLRESAPGYAAYPPEMLSLALKLIDVFNDILSIKQHR